MEIDVFHSFLSNGRRGSRCCFCRCCCGGGGGSSGGVIVMVMVTQCYMHVQIQITN